MGITARGAWESVRRHASVLGKDADRDPLTAVGIGDMSGDVFGNGMLRSRALRLVAAFDHRHVFVDPDPDPAVAFDERRAAVRAAPLELGRLRRDEALAGRRRVPADAEVDRAEPAGRGPCSARRDRPLTPNELVSVVLRAPVDLLWNGGIGTYVKASERVQRRRRRPGQRRRAGRTATSCAAGWSARAATSG